MQRPKWHNSANASKGAQTVQDLCKFSQQNQVKQINTKDNKESNPHELLTINTSAGLTWWRHCNHIWLWRRCCYSSSWSCSCCWQAAGSRLLYTWGRRHGSTVPQVWHYIFAWLRTGWWRTVHGTEYHLFVTAVLFWVLQRRPSCILGAFFYLHCQLLCMCLALPIFCRVGLL